MPDGFHALLWIGGGLDGRVPCPTTARLPASFADAGLNGIELPMHVYDRLGPLAARLGQMGIVAGAGDGKDLIRWASDCRTGFIALACPNTLRCSTIRAALLAGMRTSVSTRFWRPVTWQASLGWAAAVSVVAAIGLVYLGGQSEHGSSDEAFASSELPGSGLRPGLQDRSNHWLLRNAGAWAAFARPQPAVRGRPAA
jgi:hypothetical protein